MISEPAVFMVVEVVFGTANEHVKHSMQQGKTDTFRVSHNKSLSKRSLKAFNEIYIITVLN